jgi:hypothetical protein
MIPPFDPAWPDDIKAAWFQGFDKLLERTSQADKDTK